LDIAHTPDRSPA